MSSSGRAPRVIRSARADQDVFVLGKAAPGGDTRPAAIASAEDLRLAAEHEAAAILVAARAEAASILQSARDQAGAVRDAAYAEGLVAGRESAEESARQHLELIRGAATEGKSIRDTVAGQSAGLVARAVMLATRRIVGEYYEADPERTAVVCGEALRAAAGQEIMSIRVHPALADRLEVTLSDVARYIVPDDRVAIGGCIIDLAHGRIEATLDARLSLMELALASAGGEIEE